MSAKKLKQTETDTPQPPNPKTQTNKQTLITMAIYLEHKHLHIHNIFKPFIEFILGFCFAVSEAENCKNYPRLRNKKNSG